MPRLHVLKSSRVKDIPCRNPHEYCKEVEPIYEVHRLTRQELSELQCRPTHKIKVRSLKTAENDNLYAIFLQYTNKDVTFLRNWLKVFMLANKRNFAERARKYLSSKVLNYDHWTESINDGRKGDVLALYGLCLMFSKHAVVHLHHGLTWSTLATLGETHQDDIKKCDIHLCYIGRGLFMELVPRDMPLQILSDTATVQSLVIGELTIEEGKTYHDILHTGLGVAKTQVWI